MPFLSSFNRVWSRFIAQQGDALVEVAGNTACERGGQSSADHPDKSDWSITVTYDDLDEIGATDSAWLLFARLDEIAQQNAAFIEQTVLASESLMQQTTQLVSTVSVFC